MRIRDLMAANKGFISFEFFPPKERDKWPGFFSVVERLARFDPLFVSVTYGAGGSTRDYTLELVTRLRNEYSLTPMAHLTCVGADTPAIDTFLDELAAGGVDNVLALRGDPPKGEESFVPDNEEYKHASDLVRHIAARRPDMGIGVACYPEKHPEAVSLDQDMAHLKGKLELGGDFGVTQLFFDNGKYFDFVARLRDMGVDKPVVPGVLPIPSMASLKRILPMTAVELPGELTERLEEAEKDGGTEAVARVGIDHARDQIRNLLAGGAPGVHVYTLNRASACEAILSSL